MYTNQDHFRNEDDDGHEPADVPQQRTSGARNRERRPGFLECIDACPVTILHTPRFQADPETDSTNSEAFILVDFDRKLVLIGGTRYAGEIKESAFTIMIFLLPLFGVSEGVALTVFIVLMFACHVFMMRGAHHGGHGSHDATHTMKGNDDVHS